MTIHVRRPLLVFALVAAGVVTLAGFSVHADDSDGDGVPDAIEAATARNLIGYGFREGYFETLSVSVGAAPDAEDDEFRVVFEDATFQVEYRPSVNRVDKVRYELAFKRLVEVIGNGGEIGGGDIVQEWDLTNEYWFVATENTTTADGGRRYRFSTYPIPEVPTSRNITLTVTASSKFVRIGTVLVSPMEVKVNVSIEGWVYESANSQLAMKFEIGANVEGMAIEEDSHDEVRGWASGESQINVSGELGSIFFSWADTATADGNPIPVRSSGLLPNGDGNDWFLTYGRGSVIEHGAKLGVESPAFWALLSRANRPPPLSWDPILYALGAAMIAALVAATVVVSRRRRREP